MSFFRFISTRSDSGLSKRHTHYVVAAVCVGASFILLPGVIGGSRALSRTEVQLPQLVAVTALPIRATQSNASASNSGKTIGITNLDQLSAQAIFAVDVDSGAVLFEKNAGVLRFPASTTKLMTALVAREVFDIDQKITVPEMIDVPGNKIGLQTGEVLSVKDLLAAALIQSANDAALVLALHHPQGLSGFVAHMNQKSQALHLDQTHFSNPHGIDEEKQQTTARDLSILARAVMRDQELANLYTAKTAVLNRKTPQMLYNTHALLGREGVKGMKTGTTDLAGEVLITLAEHNQHDVLVVLMGSERRYDETLYLLNWIKNQYYWLAPSEAMTLNVANLAQP